MKPLSFLKSLLLRTTLVICAISFSLCNPCYSQCNTWTQKADFGGSGRQSTTGFSIGNKGYIGTGYANVGGDSKDFWKYDQATNSWSQIADFGGTERRGAASFSIGSKGYVGTGYDGSNTKDFWEYDTTLNAWTQKADFGGTAMYSATGISIGSKGYFACGAGGSKVFWEYNPGTDNWTQKTNYAGTGSYAVTGFSIGSKGYIGTGTNGSSDYKDFWEYNPSTNSWTQKADVGGTGRSYAVGFSIGSKGYIGTGYGASYKQDFWEYDPTRDTWIQKANFGGTARQQGAGFSIGNYGYIGVGTDGVRRIDFWEYLPEISVNAGGVAYRICEEDVVIGGLPTASGLFPPFTYSWSPSTGLDDPSLANPTASPDVTTTYTITGTDSLGCALSDSITVNRVNGNSWLQKANFGGTSRFLAVSFSIGSKGYIGTGGSNKDFWEYDQGSNSWTQKADFGGTGRYGAVGFSIGSKGYIGTGYTSTSTQDFWEYDQGSNSWTQKADFAYTTTYAVGFSIGTKGYIGTGSSNQFWEYDPGLDVWVPKTNFGGTSRYAAFGFSMGGKGYIGGGDASNKKDFWEYNPGTNTWVQKATFPGSAYRYIVGFSIGSTGYAGTGEWSNVEVADFYEYNPVSDKWTQMVDFGGGDRASAVGFSIDNKGYIGTGRNTSSFKDLWEYSPGVIVNAGTDIYVCPGDSETIGGSPTASGINSPFTYSWSTSTGLNDSTIANPNASPSVSSGYTIIVTDSNGCTDNDAVVVFLLSAISIDSESSTDIPGCYGDNTGTITITASGGTGTLYYSVDSGITFPNTTGNFTGLTAGSYNVAVQDDSSCTKFGSTLVINEPPAISIDSEASTDIPGCYGDNTGTITITASGGTGTLEFSINGGSTYPNTTGDFSGLIAGSYDVMVRDANLCTQTGSTLTINEPTQVTIDSEASTDITCNSLTDGTITLTASGGTGTLEFSINGGSTYPNTTGIFTGLSAGSYDVMVRDANLCTQAGSTLIIIDPTSVTIDSEAS
ncbi:MAG: hypothetical protein ABII90_13955, partial [Bacteroidota bacterium]